MFAVHVSLNHTIFKVCDFYVLLKNRDAHIRCVVVLYTLQMITLLRKVIKVE